MLTRSSALVASVVALPAPRIARYVEQNCIDATDATFRSTCVICPIEYEIALATGNKPQRPHVAVAWVKDQHSSQETWIRSCISHLDVEQLRFARHEVMFDQTDIWPGLVACLDCEHDRKQRHRDGLSHSQVYLAEQRVTLIDNRRRDVCDHHATEWCQGWGVAA